jgi:hypothetical protein
MTKFKALVQFSYKDTMYNPRREAYELNDDVVQEWDKEGYVKIVRRSEIE